MSKELRALWNQRTDAIKEVPPIEEVVKFIKAQADQMDQSHKPETPKAPRQQAERTQYPSRYKQRGTANVTTSDSAPVSSQPEPTSSQAPQTPRTTTRYSCPLCPEQHYPYQCGKFNQFSLSQRKKHVQDNNLCTMCLKPHHTAVNCTSTYKCRFCKGNHNSLLHQDSSADNTTNSAMVSSPRKSHLMMTSQVILPVFP